MDNENSVNGEELLSEGFVKVCTRPRFPIAVLTWYKQYSDKASARAGTVEYAMSLTPGLTEEDAGAWIDKLLSEEDAPEVAVTLA